MLFFYDAFEFLRQHFPECAEKHEISQFHFFSELFVFFANEGMRTLQQNGPCVVSYYHEGWYITGDFR